MRLVILLCLLSWWSAPLHGQAVQRKHLVISFGGGVGIAALNGPGDTLRMQPTEAGVAHFGFDYALGDRWSLGCRFDRTGTDRQVEDFDRVRFNSVLLQLTYRPWVGARAVVELQAAIGGSRLSVDPRHELLLVTAASGCSLVGARYLHMITGTIGAFATLEASSAGQGAAQFKEEVLHDAEGKDVLLSWNATRTTLGMFVRF